MYKNILFFVSFLAICPLFSQENILPRSPALNHDGSQLAFSWQGDIWTYNMETEQSTRLTVNESYEADPAWDPDGERLVFTTNRFGSADVMMMDLSTGLPNRVTYYSTSDTDPSIDGSGNIYFNSSRAYKQVERVPEIMILPKGKATPYRFMDGMGSEPVVSPDGRWLAFVRGNCRLAREQYRGPANRDIWLYDIESKTYTQITEDQGQDAHPQWTSDGELYFMSARTGRYNVHAVLIGADGTPGSIRQVTKFKNDGIRDFSISMDGKTMVVERMDEFQTVNVRNGKPTSMRFDLPGDAHQYQKKFETLDRKISGYALSPDEKYIALEAHGDLFVVHNDEKNPRANHIVRHAWKDYDPVWNTDSTLLFVSDRNGQEDIYQIRPGDPAFPSLFSSYQTRTEHMIGTPEQRELRMSVSPDYSRVALIRDYGTLLVFDIDSSGNMTNQKTIVKGWAEPTDLAWSPDSRWLAYSQPDLDFNREVFIASADGEQTPVNVSMHPRSDRGPVWSRDGSKLAFISNRNNGDDDVWFVWLKKEDWEKSKQDWKEEPFENKKEDVKKDSVAPVSIDFDKIYRRIEQVTSMPGDESTALFGPEGETIYFNGKEGENSKLFSVKWDGSDLKSIASHTLSDPTLSKDGKKIYYRSRGEMKVFTIANKRSETIPFSAKKKMNHQAERRQVFEELWRVLNDRFYDPKFHGKDWEKLKEKYQPWVMKASTAQDFRDLVNAMLGQLNASHMGLYGSNPEDTDNISTGRLGIEVKPVPNGVEIRHVVPHSPADREESKLKKGDIIRSVDGHALDQSVNFWSAFMEKENEKVWLQIERDGTLENVYIRPASSIGTQLYDEWVEERRNLTEKYSKGRLGYIHIKGMNWPSFESFERELMASGYGKEGLVIDVRYNGGGWTTDMLMTVLMVRQHAYTVPRGSTENLQNHEDFSSHYPFGERLPLSAWTMPAAAICNHSSYSNAEIFSHAFKTLDRGPLIGEPTFGAVISTGGHSLMDGSFVRLPFRGWFVKATHANMEGTPAVPDYILLNPPGIKAQGKDPQLEKAVEVLLKAMD